MSNETNYPKWQEQIRKAQAERDEERYQKNEADREKRLKKNREELAILRENLAKIGLTELEETQSNSGQLVLAGYGYQFSYRWNNYEELVFIRKGVPYSDPEIENEIGYEYQYRTAIYRSADMKDRHFAAKFADSIDSVEEECKSQIEHNKRAIARHEEEEARRAQPSPKSEYEPTLAERLEGIIRQIIREQLDEVYS